MKKILLLLTAIYFFANPSKAQFPYASIWAGYPQTYEVSSGLTTTATPGCLWFGYMSTVQNIQTTWHVNKNFCVMGAGPSSIWAAYQIFDANSCTGSLSQVLNGNGVSVIETAGSNNLTYAVAGSYDKAVYFATLNNTGGVMTAVSYPFPVLPTQSSPLLNTMSLQQPAPSKPLIVESSVANEYYICGSYDAHMYILNVDATGTVIWSSFYSLAEGISPRDIIVNPYISRHIAVVGQAKLSSGNTQGFFMDVNGNNGAVAQTQLYGQSVNCEVFNSITLGSNAGANNGSGFVVGGFTKQISDNTGRPWVLKLDSVGGVIWSKIHTPSIGSCYDVKDVMERLNTFNTYEYYVLLASSAGMQVLKLNDGGLPFAVSSPSSLHNEFVYNIPSLVPAKPTCLSFVANPGNSFNAGIQVYGTSYNFPGFNGSYVVNAYYNGETGCYQTLSTITECNDGPKTGAGVAVTRFGNLSACTNFMIQAFYPGGSISYPCYGPVPAGDNQRVMGQGLEQAKVNTESIQVFPNPANDKTVIHYSAADNSSVQIDLYNVAGELVWQKSPESNIAGAYEQEIDFTALELKPGVYFVNVQIDGVTTKQKVVYTH